MIPIFSGTRSIEILSSCFISRYVKFNLDGSIFISLCNISFIGAKFDIEGMGKSTIFKISIEYCFL